MVASPLPKAAMPMPVLRRHLALLLTLALPLAAQQPPAQPSQNIAVIQQRANAGDAAAQNLLGDCYRFAINIGRDFNLAGFWYRKAAEQGNLEAENSLGDMAYYGQGEAVDYVQSLDWYRKAADKGNAKGEFNVGYMYAHGRSIAQDFKQAFDWYRKAADQNYADAENLLGDMYYYGRGISVDYDQALALYHKAADRGDATGQFNVGYMYANGRAVQLDYAQAIAWYRKAADQNQFEAENSLGDMYYYGLGVAQDYAQSIVWYNKAAAQGDPNAQYHLGLCYEWGRGIAKDIAQARTWLQKAAEQGAQPARDEIAKLDAPPLRGFAPEGQPAAAPPAPAIPIPHNYALIFATDEYAHWPHLTNPVSDADAVNQALTSLYAFKVEEVRNATDEQILAKLTEYLHRKFEPQDQLFIFFSGHGYFDPDLGKGYLVPANALLVQDDIGHRSLLAHETVMSYVNRIPAAHVVLVLDACFSGTLDRKVAETGLRGDPSTDIYAHATLPELLERKEPKRTRRYITSGGKDFVPDGLPGHHSPFISAFLITLNDGADRKGYLTLNDIQQGLQSVNPEPRWGDIQQDNDPGADFLLLTPQAVAALSHSN
jgi:TPR repeat protein